MHITSAKYVQLLQQLFGTHYPAFLELAPINHQLPITSLLSILHHHSILCLIGLMILKALRNTVYIHNGILVFQSKEASWALWWACLFPTLRRQQEDLEVKLASDMGQVQFSLSYTRYCLKYKMRKNNNKKVLLFFIARIYLEVTILRKITQEAFLNEFPKTAKCKLYLILLFCVGHHPNQH